MICFHKCKCNSIISRMYAIIQSTVCGPVCLDLHSPSKETQHGKLCFFLGRVQIDELCSVSLIQRVSPNCININQGSSSVYSASIDRQTWPELVRPFGTEKSLAQRLKDWKLPPDIYFLLKSILLPFPVLPLVISSAGSRIQYVTMPLETCFSIMWLILLMYFSGTFSCHFMFVFFFGLYCHLI